MASPREGAVVGPFESAYDEGKATKCIRAAHKRIKSASLRLTCCAFGGGQEDPSGLLLKSSS